MRAFIERVFKSKKQKQKEILDEITHTEIKDQATEAVVEAIIKEVKEEVKKELKKKDAIERRSRVGIILKLMGRRRATPEADLKMRPDALRPAVYKSTADPLPNPLFPAAKNQISPDISAVTGR